MKRYKEQSLKETIINIHDIDSACLSISEGIKFLADRYGIENPIFIHNVGVGITDGIDSSIDKSLPDVKQILLINKVIMKIFKSIKNTLSKNYTF